jgi:hypothetical protein
MKKSTKVLHYFDLDCGMLKFFKYTTHEPESKEQLLTLPHFWRPVWQNCGVAHALPRLSKKVGGLEVFLYEAYHNFELFSNIQDQNKKKYIKTCMVDVLFKAYSMVPLSG